jgi:hypothetical protein
MEPRSLASVDRALGHVRTLAAPGPALDPALRVTVHFHPDRLFRGEPILAAMARDGVYRSQFETLTSNGGLTAQEGPGGARWQWESRIFGGAYDAAPASERPRYGALNHRGRSVGGSPRFGSAHFRLALHTLARTTFCFPDSYHNPRDFGLADRMPLLPFVTACDRSPPANWDPLDTYIEAHVHGPIHLPSDVEALVLDPSHKGTETERLAAALNCPIEWHEGFRLHTSVLAANANYRSAEHAALAQSLVEDGVLSARIIGDASRTGRFDDQALKKVWHYVAMFGAPDTA